MRDVGIAAGRIAAVEPTLSAEAASTLDARGKLVVPGLIDMHTHVSKTRASALGLLVSAGVTTVRDMGGDHD